MAHRSVAPWGRKRAGWGDWRRQAERAGVPGSLLGEQVVCGQDNT